MLLFRRLTGNTSGMPPRTGLLPSSLAASLSQSFSAPAAVFQLMTVAPYRRISTDSPVGRRATTRSSSASTAACGANVGVAASAVGLCERSTMVAGLWGWCEVVGVRLLVLC
jgi:hypothetical protein